MLFPFSKCSCKLKYILLLFIPYISYIQADWQCPTVVKCADTNYITKDDNQCIYYHQTNQTNVLDVFEVDLTKCKSGFHCQTPTEKKNYTCLQDETAINLVPGKECKSSTECASKSCDNGKCKGRPMGSPCLTYLNKPNHNECEKGLFCGKMNTTELTICQSQKDVNQNCTYSYECKNNLACNFGKCIKYYTVPSGSIAETEQDACSSGRGVRLPNTNGITCGELKFTSNVNGTCSYNFTYANSSINVSHKVLCPLSGNSNGDCQYDNKSPEWNDFLNSISNFINSDIFLNSHIYYKNNIKELDKDMYKRIMTTQSYPKFKDANQCIINLYLSGGYHKLSFLGLLFVLISILLF